MTRRTDALDRYLTEAVGDMFAHDDRLRGLAVDVNRDLLPRGAKAAGSGQQEPRR